MRENDEADEAEDQALERVPNLADETVEQARHVLKGASQAAGGATQAHQHATSARERAAMASAGNWRRMPERSSC